MHIRFQCENKIKWRFKWSVLEYIIISACVLYYFTILLLRYYQTQILSIKDSIGSSL